MIAVIDLDRLVRWQSAYDEARQKFTCGAITRLEAIHALAELRFRSDALKVEIGIWDKERQEFQERKLALAWRYLEPQIREWERERTAATSSSE